MKWNREQVFWKTQRHQSTSVVLTMNRENPTRPNQKWMKKLQGLSQKFRVSSKIKWLKNIYATKSENLVEIVISLILITEKWTKKKQSTCTDQLLLKNLNWLLKILPKTKAQATNVLRKGFHSVHCSSHNRQDQ